MPGTDADFIGPSQIVTSGSNGVAPKSPSNAFKALDGGATPAWSSFDKLIATPVVASTTVSADVVNTTETLLTPISTIPFPANQAAIGSTIRLRFWGRQTKTGIGSPSANFRLRFGGLTGTVLLSTSALANTTAQTNGPFFFDVEITFRTIGAAGTVWANAIIISGTTSTTLVPVSVALATTGIGPIATVTVDTTALSDIALTVEYSANTAGNSVTIDQVKAWLD